MSSPVLPLYDLGGEPREGLMEGRLLDPDSHLQPDNLESIIADLHEIGPVIDCAGRDLSQVQAGEIVWPTEADPYRLVVGYEAVKQASLDDALSSAENGVFAFDEKDSETLGEIPGDLLLHTDGDRHKELHAAYMNAFRDLNIFQMYESLETFSDVIVARALDMGSFDVVKDLTAPLPLEVVSQILGGLQSDVRDRMATVARYMGFYDDSRFTKDPKTAKDNATELVVMGLTGYQAEIDRLDQPGGIKPDEKTVMTQLAEAVANGESGVTLDDLCAFFVLLAVAGTETTSTANARGIMAFQDNTDQLEHLIANRGDEEIMGNARREIRRFTSPAAFFRRTATRDTEIEGVPIAAGDKVILSYLAANRDPKVFDDPNRFDVTRQFNAGTDEISFGWGPHRCLGARLADQEMKAFFSSLFGAMAERNIRLELGEPDFARSSFLRGIAELPATVVGAAKG